MTDKFSVALDSDPAVKPGTAVAVSGATGFIGGRLIARLLEQGALVTCLVRNERPPPHLVQAGANIVTLDLTDRHALQAALAGVEFFFHCAFDWANPTWNMEALDALVAVCGTSGCRRLVHLSSYVVYELPRDGEVTEETPSGTSAGYADTKRKLESELLRAVQNNKLPAAILQPTLVYGPFSRPFAIEPAEMLRYGTVMLPDSGNGTCNVVYVDDVVSAMIVAAQHDRAIGQRFLISGPAPITWRHYYEALAEAVGANGPVFRPADALTRDDARLAQLMRFVRDPERIVRRLAITGPGRKLSQAALARLPQRLQSGARERLFSPVSQRRGFVHVPNKNRLTFLQSRATVHSAKARSELGYAPRFDFAAGMIPTARFLQQRFASADLPQ